MDRYKKLYSIAENILDGEVKKNFLAERYKKIPDSEYDDEFFDILDTLMVYAPDTARGNFEFMKLKERLFRRYGDSISKLIHQLVNTNEEFLKGKMQLQKEELDEGFEEEKLNREVERLKLQILKWYLSNYLYIDSILFCIKFKVWKGVLHLFLPKLLGSVVVGLLFILSSSEFQRFIKSNPLSASVSSIIAGFLYLVFLESSEVDLALKDRVVQSFFVLILGFGYSILLTMLFKHLLNLNSLEPLIAFSGFSLLVGLIVQVFWIQEVITKS